MVRAFGQLMVKVLVISHGDFPIKIKSGKEICFMKYPQILVKTVLELLSKIIRSNMS